MAEFPKAEDVLRLRTCLTMQVRAVEDIPQHRLQPHNQLNRSDVSRTFENPTDQHLLHNVFDAVASTRARAFPVELSF